MTEALFVKKLELCFLDEGFFTKCEVGVGYGIADLVLFKPNKQKILKRLSHAQHTRLLSENYFKVLSVITDSETKKKPTSLRSIEKNVSVSSQTLRYKILPKLKDCGYVKEVDNGYYLKVNGWLPIGKELIAIEAKLHDWKKGLQQAIRYKAFANRVYLAVPSNIAKNAQRALLEKHGVGLISFDPESGKKKVIVNAPIRKPNNPHKRDYASEYFWNTRVKKEAYSLR